MRFALHPVTRKRITPEQYVREFGHRSVDRRISDNRPEAICPFCQNGVFLAAEATTRTAHFRHHAGGFCPSSEPAGRSYIGLPPGRRDPVAGARLRAAFRRNWRRHFAAVNKLVPFLSPEEFIGLLEIATENRIWDYKGFRETDIPYSLLLLADFPPWTSTRRNRTHERRLWIRFWYSPNVRTIDMLWIEPVERVQLFRAFFEPPARRNGRPAYEDLIRYDPVPIDRDFLEGPEPRVATFVDATVEAWLGARPSFNGSP